MTLLDAGAGRALTNGARRSPLDPAVSEGRPAEGTRRSRRARNADPWVRFAVGGIGFLSSAPILWRHGRGNSRAPMRKLICPVIAAVMIVGASAAQSRMLTIVGYAEDALILPEGLAMQARMDTGARTAAINAVDIQRYSKNGEDWVRFTVKAGDRAMVFHRRVAGRLTIRRAGHADREQVVVQLGICVAGYYKHARVRLADRSNMTYPLLIGRRLMASGGLVIDSAAEFLSKPVCAGDQSSAGQP